MSRQALEKKDFTFVGGLNTEAGALTFPNNAWLDGDNLEPHIDGSIRRRLKIDFEASNQAISSFATYSKENNAYGSYLWPNAGGHGNITFVVVQLGAVINFFATSASSLTPQLKGFSIDLHSYAVPTSPNVLGTSPIDVAVGNGKLVIVSEDTEPILVEYDLDSDNITVTEITLQIRDLLGINDGYPVDFIGVPLTAAHNYNLLNQGWDNTKIIAYQAATASLVPSNTQIWTEGKNATDDFDPLLLNKQDFGTTPAPRGSFILDLFNRDRSSVSMLSGLTSEVENYRFTTVAFYAGRTWYAGIKSSKIGSWVAFSQIVEDDTKYGKLYQEGDPTSEFNSDLVATDGGTIPIPEAGGIKKLLPIQGSLIVFADNGIWQISGSSSGFTATSYQVTKISSFGCISQFSVLEAEATAMYWSPAGIFGLTYDALRASFSVQPISLGKIQTLYSAIPNFGKKFCSGFYNDEIKKVYWLYQETSTESSIDRFKKTRMLIFDLRLGAFYTYTLASGASYPIVISGILTTNQGTQTINFSVIEIANSVLSSTDSVITSLTFPATSPRLNKFLTLMPSAGNWAYTFSDFEATQNTPEKFFDWFSFDGVGIEPDVLPYLVTGYQILEDGMKIFQAPYIITYMKRTETGFEDAGSGNLNSVNQSSCSMQGKWQWTDSSTANRWSAVQEVYRHKRMYTPDNASSPYDDGFPVVVAKSKLRGKGDALSIKYSAASGKDMQMLGWAISYAKNTNV